MVCQFVLDAAQVSFTILRIANAAAGVAQCMFPGVPCVPPAVMEKGESILETLAVRSSGCGPTDFLCAQKGDAGSKESGEDRFKTQVGLKGAG